MKDKNTTENVNNKEKQRNEKYALVLMYSAIMMAIIVIASAIVATTNNNEKEKNQECESLSVAYAELESKYDEAFDKYIEYNHLYADLKNEKNNSLEKNELEEINQDIIEAKDELAGIENEIESAKTTKAEEESKYNEEIKALEQQLTSIKEKIDSNKNEPLSFYAGEYICGQDFPAGRYMIYDGKSNFFVRGGEIYVNIILGDDPNWGQVSEYVHFFTEGEQIEADSPFKLKLVE